MEDTIVRLFEIAGPGTDSSLDTKKMAVIHRAVNRSVDKAFQSCTFQSAVEEAVSQCLAESHVANEVLSSTTDLLASTVSATKFVMKEVENRSLEEAEVERYQNASNSAIVGYGAKAKDEFPPQNMDLSRFRSLSTDTSDSKNRPRTGTVTLCLWTSRISATMNAAAPGRE